MFKNKFLVILILLFNKLLSVNFITNEPSVQLGDNIAVFSLTKILSLKYNLKFLCTPFKYAELFVLDDIEKKIIEKKFKERIQINNEEDITNNLHKNNVLFTVTLFTKIDHIKPVQLKELKKVLKFKEKPQLFKKPKDKITIAVHIRKGNGGGEIYDGQLASEQLYKHDKNLIKYINYFNYPFDWGDIERKRHLDQFGPWETKFPPEQFYVDQIIKVSNLLKNKKIYLQIFTDDQDPLALIKRIKKAVKKSNITFNYHDNRSLDFKERIAQDLFNMSKFDILIRSQSYFSRAAELIGNHKMVIYPLRSHWDNNKLIMDTIVIKKS